MGDSGAGSNDGTIESRRVPWQLLHLTQEHPVSPVCRDLLLLFLELEPYRGRFDEDGMPSDARVAARRGQLALLEIGWRSYREARLELEALSPAQCHPGPDGVLVTMLQALDRRVSAYMRALERAEQQLLRCCRRWLMALAPQTALAPHVQSVNENHRCPHCNQEYEITFWRDPDSGAIEAGLAGRADVPHAISLGWLFQRSE